MAQGTISGVIGGVTKSILAFLDGSNNVAACAGLVDTNGSPVGTANNPLIIAELPYQGVTAMTVGTTVTAGRAIRINCTAAGNISLTYADGSTDVVPVNVGLSYIPGAFTKVNSSGTTATATFANLR